MGLEGCTLLVVNEYEFEMLRDKTGLTATEIRTAPSQASIVTRGMEGSQIWTPNADYAIPPVTPSCIDDPTGVGDAYRAGLIKGLALGLPWDLIGRMGSVAATYALEQPGPQNHYYTTADFVSRFRTFFEDAGQLAAMQRI